MPKKLKSIIICFITILIFLLAFERPILSWYFTYRSFVVEFIYNNAILLHDEYNNKTNETENIMYEVFSDEIHIKLPNHSENVIVKLNHDSKSYSYGLQACFEYSELYCLIFRQSLRYFPLSNKTHKSDKLVVLNKDGEEVCAYESMRDEWIVDYDNNTILIFNSKENSFYYKNIVSGAITKMSSNELDRYTKIILEKQNGTWNVYYYREDELVLTNIVEA